MKTSRRGLLHLALALISLSACSSGEDAPADRDQPDTPEFDALGALVESEIAFATAAEARGTGLAFREFIAEDGIIFRPGPTLAGPWFAEREPGNGTLAWVPVHAAIASSGDLGYTTGPYRAGPEATASWGHYVSLWKLRDDGTFKVALDIGTPHGEPSGGLPSLAEAHVATDSTGTPTPGSPSDSPSSPESLFEADEHLTQLLKQNGVMGALMEVGTAGTRLHRTGAPPFTNRDQIVGTPNADERFAVERLGGELSRSGTFGYTFGASQKEGSDTVGNYLAIWRRDPGDPWRLLLLLTDAP